jgi:hypothetical protein
MVLLETLSSLFCICNIFIPLDSFSRSFSLRRHRYPHICHEKKIGGVGEVTAFNYHVDAIRFFRTESSLRPYIVAGFGNIETEIDKKKNREFQLNGGFGLHYKINPNWFLRGDCRLFYETDTDMKDGAAHFIVGYRFGKGER